MLLLTSDNTFFLEKTVPLPLHGLRVGSMQTNKKETLIGFDMFYSVNSIDLFFPLEKKFALPIFFQGSNLSN